MNCLIIIPTYNETENITKIIDEIFSISKKIPSWKIDILIVDDNSPDGTAHIVRKIQSSNSNVHLLTGRKNGLGAAYLKGFKFGLKNSKYQVFIMMDADFSHDPKSIPALLNAISDGVDYASGSRYIHGGSISAEWPAHRKLNSRMANWFARIATGNTAILDLTGGFKAIRRDALEQIDLSRISARGYAFLVSLLHEFSRHNLVIREVPIHFTDRQYGKSKIRLYDIVEFIYITYRLNPQSRARRLIRFILVGASGTIVNLTLLTVLVRFFAVDVIHAVAVAIEGSILSNFTLNHLYTFRASFTSPRTSRRDSVGQVVRKLIRYNLISLGGAAISFTVFAFCYRKLRLPYLIADSVGIIVAVSWNYWMSVRIVWKTVDD